MSRRRRFRSALVTLLALAVGLPALATPALAGQRTTRVDARLDADRGRLSGRLTALFDNRSARSIDRVYLWLLPNRTARPPAALGDVNYYWIYPRRFSPGSMALSAVRAGSPGHERPLPEDAWRPEEHAVAGERVLWSIALPEPIPPGRSLRVIIEYRVVIPERYGSFGCIAGQCTLAGGLHPMIAALETTGWDLAGPPMRSDMDVRVELTRPASALLFDELVGHIPASALRQRDRAFPPETTYPPAVRVEARRRDAAYAALFVAPRLYESVRQAGTEAESVTLRYIAAGKPPPADDARGQLLPYTQEDHARFGLDTAAEALDLLAALELPLRVRRLTMIEAPLRAQVAESHPGAVLVSDRFYRIWPAERFRKLHRRQLVRAVFGQILARRVAERGAEHARDIPIAADLAASYLTDLHAVGRYDKNEQLDDILEPVSFIPMIDLLIYEPQTLFHGAYFGGVLDDEPLRDHPERFMHQRPRGRLYYEKLRDLLRPDALRAALRAILADGRAVRSAAEEVYGSPLAWFFEQWARPYPRLDYRIAQVASRELENGLKEHAVTIERRRAPGDPAIVEPVQVRIILDDGSRRDVRWHGRGDRGVVRVRATSAVDRVELDPAGRLVERHLPGDNQHPGYNNRTEPRRRFVYNSAGVLLNVTDLSALLAADFSLGRVHDVKNQLRFGVYSSASTLVGGSLGYRRNFGPVVTMDRLRWRSSLTLGGGRLRAGFFGDVDPRPATRFSLGAALRRSTRTSFFHPKGDEHARLAASLTVTRRDASATDSADVLVSGSLSARVARLYTPVGGHTLAGELAAGMVAGSIETRSQLFAAGGADGLRGHGPAALFGRAYGMARVEYRHVLMHDLSWNFGHYSIMRGIGGAVFADAAWLSPCDSYGPGDGGFNASVGYGLRVFYDSFGALPQLMRVDVAARVTGRGRDCLGSEVDDSPPVTVYLTFLPPF